MWQRCLSFTIVSSHYIRYYMSWPEGWYLNILILSQYSWWISHMTSNITKDQFTQGGPFFSMSLAVMLHHSVGGIVPCIPIGSFYIRKWCPELLDAPGALRASRAYREVLFSARARWHQSWGFWKVFYWIPIFMDSRFKYEVSHIVMNCRDPQKSVRAHREHGEAGQLVVYTFQTFQFFTIVFWVQSLMGHFEHCLYSIK